MSLESPVGNLDFNASSAPSCSISFSRQKVALSTKTEGTVPCLSSEENRGIKIEFSARVKEQSSPIVIFSTEEAEETCKALRNGSSGGINKSPQRV